MAKQTLKESKANAKTSTENEACEQREATNNKPSERYKTQSLKEMKIYKIDLLLLRKPPRVKSYASRKC